MANSNNKRGVGERTGKAVDTSLSRTGEAIDTGLTRTGEAIGSGVQYVGSTVQSGYRTGKQYASNVWDRCANMVVLVVALILLVVWYTQPDVTSMYSRVTDRLGFGAVGSRSTPTVTATGTTTLAPMIEGEIGTGVGAPTAAEIRALFNF